MRYLTETHQACAQTNNLVEPHQKIKLSLTMNYFVVAPPLELLISNVCVVLRVQYKVNESALCWGVKKQATAK